MAEKSPSKKSAAVSKKVSKPAKPTRPPTSEMVLAAVTALQDRKGSSLQAIKKYIGITYKLDMDKTAIFIRNTLRKAVSEGVLVQAKGNGARGSFKLPSSEKKSGPPKKSTKASGEKRGRGRPPKSAADEGKKKSTPKKKKPGATTKKASATSAKKPKVKTTATTKKKAGRSNSKAKGAKSTPKKK